MQLVTGVGGSSTWGFPMSVFSGSNYQVTVSTQPMTIPSLTCNVVNGTGVMGAGNVTVNITCMLNTFTIGGTITNLKGTGLKVANTANGDLLAVAAMSNSFTLASPVQSSYPYNVVVQTNPSSPSQVCTLSNSSGSGSVGYANVTNVTIDCVSQNFGVGGTVTGLNGSLTLNLQGMGGLQTSVIMSGPGAVSFGWPMVPSGTSYDVEVASQPLTQKCVPSNNMGTVGNTPISTIAVDCQNLWTVGGTVSNLKSAITLSLNGIESVAVPANATSFAFGTRLLNGASFTVGIVPPLPTVQTCVLTPNMGMATGPVNIGLTCMP
jgi:hypothetical protein